MSRGRRVTLAYLDRRLGLVEQAVEAIRKREDWVTDTLGKLLERSGKAGEAIVTMGQRLEASEELTRDGLRQITEVLNIVACHACRRHRRPKGPRGAQAGAMDHKTRHRALRRNGRSRG